jgi:hypothetical protein
LPRRRVEAGLRIEFIEAAEWRLFYDGIGNEGGIFAGKVYRSARDGVEVKGMPEAERTFLLALGGTLHLSDVHRGCRLSVVERDGKQFLRGIRGYDLPGGSGGKWEEFSAPL